MKCTVSKCISFYVDKGGSGNFFSLPYNVNEHVQYFSQFFVHINVELFIHVFMHPCFFCGGEKKAS